MASDTLRTVLQILARIAGFTVAGGLLGGLVAWLCIEGASGCDGGLCALCFLFVPAGGLVGFFVAMVTVVALLNQKHPRSYLDRSEGP